MKSMSSRCSTYCFSVTGRTGPEPFLEVNTRPVSKDLHATEAPEGNLARRVSGALRRRDSTRIADALLPPLLCGMPIPRTECVEAARDHFRQEPRPCPECGETLNTEYHPAGSGGYVEVSCQSCDETATIDMRTEVNVPADTKWMPGDIGSFGVMIGRNRRPICPNDGAVLRVDPSRRISTKQKANVECLLCRQSASVEY